MVESINEYINKNELLKTIYMFPQHNPTELIINMPPSDVVERSKIDKAIAEIEEKVKDDYWSNIFCGGIESVLEIIRRNIGE